jgi:hypothetical protein
MVTSRGCFSKDCPPAVDDVCGLSMQFFVAVRLRDWPRARELRDKIKEWKP